MARTLLPPGFRFHPTDVELVCYYLKRKVMGKPFRFEAIPEVELYKFAPWDLPEKSLLRSKDLEWYFFCPRDKKYPNGYRTNRATDSGYWKATGKDRSIVHNSHIIGMKKTLIFHIGKVPKGDRTDWVMYEYRLEGKEIVDAGFSLDTYVLCKVFQKSGMGPKIGEQYGAPFNEADWDEDITEDFLYLPCASSPSREVLDHQASSSAPVHQEPAASGVVEASLDLELSDADGILLAELAEFLNASPLLDNTNRQISDLEVLIESTAAPPAHDSQEIYNDLEDFSAQAMMPSNLSYDDLASEYPLHPMLSELGNGQYLELNDFLCLGESNPPGTITTNGVFGQCPSVHDPNVQCAYDTTCYFNRLQSTSSMVSYPAYAEPDITVDESSLSFQIEDFDKFMLQENSYLYFQNACHGSISHGPI